MRLGHPTRSFAATFFITALVLAASPVHAETATLECGKPPNMPYPAPQHTRLVIDFGAGTVRRYVIDDDQVISFDRTYQADIADNVVNWSEAFPRGVSNNMSLGRYTGTLTWKTTDTTRSPATTTATYPCFPWTQPQQQKVF